jgi:glycolate oxidase
MIEPVLSNAHFDRAAKELLKKLGSKFAHGSEACAPYQTDDTGIEGCAFGVVVASSVDDIKTALQICERHSIPLTSRAGGTGRTGGAVPIQGGIVLATHQLNSIVDFNRKEGTIVVGPGLVLDELWATVEAEGWFYPPDPNSSSNCQMAGNVAENAAGPRALKYGSTRDYVLGMDTYLMGGQHFFSGRRTKKGVTGYDTTALLVGSEGTLGVFGNITLRLIPRPERVMTLLALFSSSVTASRAVEGIIEARLSPRCLEFLDEWTLQVMRDGGSAIDLKAQSMLLIEVDGDEVSCATQSERIAEICSTNHALSVVVAQSENQRSQLWASRKQMSQAVRKFARHKISEDVVVPRQQLMALIEHVRASRERHDITALCYGHAGDGNLHVNFLWDNDEQKAGIDRATHELFVKTIELGGTLSGEHGIGLTKSSFLHLEQSATQIALQQRLKTAFDPKGLMNPGKIFPRFGHGPC